ncbi:MAG: hypothetical protein FJ294_08230 [Planctomycetes bacterium]|nr:hypothetical protein [Planctomycetota bacterium]
MNILSGTRLLALALSMIGHAHGQILTFVDSLQFSSAQIWGVCSDAGDSLCVTTVFSPSSRPHIFMRKVNYSVISQQSPPVQLTFDVDFAAIPNLTDHKTVILNDQIYISFSTQGDRDLFLFKTDINGNRIGSIVTVVSGSADPTNDMILTTDGSYIYVLHFDPPSQHHVYKFNSNLNAVGSPISTTTLMHNNIGHSVYRNSIFHLFTGSTFGFNSSLTHTKWNSSWGAISSQNILGSTGGDGNFFSTGAIFDSTNQRWYIALNHIYAGQSIGQEHIDLLAYDSNFNLLERKHVTTENYTRPHLVQKGGHLYMTYDRPGVGVYLRRYQVSGPVAYCTAGTSSGGCVPEISGLGTPSIAASSGFNISVAPVPGQKQGLFFYGTNGRMNTPWATGSSSVLCVKSPTSRTQQQNSGGTSGCDGTLSIDWLSFIASHPGLLGTPTTAGQVVDAQAWYRDPAAVKSTNLSAGLEFTMLP